jgi:hypothetical protein
MVGIPCLIYVRGNEIGFDRNNWSHWTIAYILMAGIKAIWVGSDFNFFYWIKDGNEYMDWRDNRQGYIFWKAEKTNAEIDAEYNKRIDELHKKHGLGKYAQQ